MSMCCMMSLLKRKEPEKKKHLGRLGIYSYLRYNKVKRPIVKIRPEKRKEHRTLGLCVKVNDYGRMKFYMLRSRFDGDPLVCG